MALTLLMSVLMAIIGWVIVLVFFGETYDFLKFVFISTADVYGIRDFSGEDVSTLRFDDNLRNPYPRYKIKSELWLKANLPPERFACIRPAAVWGPGDETLERRVTTVGTGQPHVEIKIIDPETGKTVPPNTVGELCCRGYNVMKGYYNMPEETAKAIDSEGWLHSGDLGTVDEDGDAVAVGFADDCLHGVHRAQDVAHMGKAHQLCPGGEVRSNRRAF